MNITIIIAAFFGMAAIYLLRKNSPPKPLNQSPNQEASPNSLPSSINQTTKEQAPHKE